MSIDPDFEKRVGRVLRAHDRMRRTGVVHHVGRDGLIRARPRVARPRASLRGILIVVLAGLFLKGLLWAQIGAVGYAERVETLRGGTAVARAGAWLMQPDNVTVWIGGELRPYLRH
jgi:hypothetical protein